MTVRMETEEEEEIWRLFFRVPIQVAPARASAPNLKGDPEHPPIARVTSFNYPPPRQSKSNPVAYLKLKLPHPE